MWTFGFPTRSAPRQRYKSNSLVGDGILSGEGCVQLMGSRDCALNPFW